MALKPASVDAGFFMLSLASKTRSINQLRFPGKHSSLLSEVCLMIGQLPRGLYVHAVLCFLEGVFMNDAKFSGETTAGP